MKTDPTTADLAAAVETVFWALGGDGCEAFERLCLDNGLLWRCACRWINPIDREHCGECDKPRASADDDE